MHVRDDDERTRPQDPVGSFPCPPFLVRLPEAHSRPSPVLVDELDARGLTSAEWSLAVTSPQAL